MKVREYLNVYVNDIPDPLEIKIRRWTLLGGTVARFDAVMLGTLLGCPDVEALGYMTPIQALDVLLEMEVPDGFE
jgi:hypothetical protein